jgi:hypothetical protein
VGWYKVITSNLRFPWYRVAANKEAHKPCKAFTVATMTWLTTMEYPCHKWPRICSTCSKQFPVLFSFMDKMVAWFVFINWLVDYLTLREKYFKYIPCREQFYKQLTVWALCTMCDSNYYIHFFSCENLNIYPLAPQSAYLNIHPLAPQSAYLIHPHSHTRGPHWWRNC